MSRQCSAYELELPSQYRTSLPMPDETVWCESLVRDFSAESATFMPAEAVLKIDGQDVLGRVYENRERTGQFLIMNPDILVVDFGLQKVGTAGMGGISFHAHPGGRMIVCLNYNLRKINGVPLGNPKMPFFTKRRVVRRH